MKESLMSSKDEQNLENLNSASNLTQAQDNEEEDLLVSQLNMDITNQYVVFSVGEEEYGIPILSVQEIISIPNLTRIPGVPDYIPGIINLRGNIIPLYILRSKFELSLQELNSDTIVIIVQTGDEKKKTVGFIVDSVSDVVSITEDNLKPTPEFSGAVDVRFVEKIGQLGNRMIIIISLENFFSDKENKILDSAIESTG
jgi:purine-binding chemotaxis protein CheW